MRIEYVSVDKGSSFSYIIYYHILMNIHYYMYLSKQGCDIRDIIMALRNTMTFIFIK